MSNSENDGICYFCKRGKFTKTNEEIAFHQWTDKGYVFCRVKIPLGICDRCGSWDWNEDTEAIVQAAIRREYDKLP